MNIDSTLNKRQIMDTILTIRAIFFNIQKGNLNLIYYEQEIVQKLEELESLLECQLEEDFNQAKINTAHKLIKKLGE